VRALDVVDTVLLDDDENLAMDNLLLEWVRRVVDERPYWNPQGRRWAFGAHQAAGTLSFYAAVNYLLKNGNPDPGARRLLDEQRSATREFLDYMATSFKDRQKDVGWETWTSLVAPARYAMAEGNMAFFESGTAADTVKRRYFADQGTHPAGILAYLYNDARYTILAPDGHGLSGWAFVMSGPNL
jgi:hypothetical protein